MGAGRSFAIGLTLALLAHLLQPEWYRGAVVGGQAVQTNVSALVVVNSQSADYGDFQRYIQPYLDHLGVPYATLDISSRQLTSDVSSYSLIVVGHRGRDVGRNHLDATEESYIENAVAAGVGLVNFDNALTRSGSMDPEYGYVQTIFGLAYVPASPADVVAIEVADGDPRHYITAAQPEGNRIHLRGGIVPLGVEPPAGARVLATLGSSPLLIARSSGAGRAVQWTSYEWMKAAVKGYVYGMDDLVWRSLVWAARKPFLMRGMPPFVTMRIDDGAGGDGEAHRNFDYVATANRYGFKPYVSIFLREIDDAEAGAIKSLVDQGGMTVGVHARTDRQFFFYDHDNWRDLPDHVVAENFAQANAFFDGWGIARSKLVIPHYYEFGTNVFAGLSDWGVEFVGTVLPVGASYWDDTRPYHAGPYRRYEVPGANSDRHPLAFADWVEVPGHPEFDGRFFNVVTEVRDDAGYEWYPEDNVEVSIRRGFNQVKRAFDSMVLATLFTHEYFISGMAPENWDATLAGLAERLAPYGPIYVTYDHAARYARALRTSRLSEASYDAAANRLSIRFDGTSDVTTSVYLFTGSGESIEHRLVDVPAFASGYSATLDLAGALTPGPTVAATGTATPVPTVAATGTPTPVPAVTLSPTSTATVAVGPTSTVVPTVGPGGVVIELWEDEHQSPVLATFGDPGLLDPWDGEWDEFLWEPRGYPGVFADPREGGLPVMRFHAEVPSGTYRLVANLYHRSDYRYYYGFSADRPRAHSFDVTVGPWGDFQEFDLGEVVVSDGLFELYTDGADLIGGEPYFFGWSWLRLVPVSASTSSSGETASAAAGAVTLAPSPTATAGSPASTAHATYGAMSSLQRTPTPTPTGVAGGEMATPTWTATATATRTARAVHTTPNPPSGVAAPPRPALATPAGVPATPGPGRATAGR